MEGGLARLRHGSLQIRVGNRQMNTTKATSGGDFTGISFPPGATRNDETTMAQMCNERPTWQPGHILERGCNAPGPKFNQRCRRIAHLGEKGRLSGPDCDPSDVLGACRQVQVSADDQSLRRPRLRVRLWFH